MLQGMLTQIALRIPEECIIELDELVAEGQVATRSEAARYAIVHFLEDRRTERDVQRLIDSYVAAPQTDEEVADALVVLNALIAEEPW
jgi:Arc/MetJ-type ribon-helix-helix transcriptional regulator